MNKNNNDKNLQLHIEKLQQNVKELEKELIEYKEKFRVLTASSPVGIFLDDSGGTATYINNKGAELIGIPLDDALNLDWSKSLHPDDKVQVLSDWLKAVKNGQESHREYRWVHQNGEIIWTLGSIVPIKEQNGDISNFIGTLTEITDWKRALEKRDYIQKQQNKKQKMESLEQMADGVTHDFNNMLAIVIGYAELLLAASNLTEKQSSKIHEILMAAKRSRDITRLLLAFTRKLPVKPQLVSLNTFVSNQIKYLQQHVGENIELSWQPSSFSLFIKIDPSQIMEILVALLNNAKDAITGTGKIAIKTDKAHFDEPFCDIHPEYIPGEYVLLKVTDDGCGMDRETLDRIFEPFFTSKGKHKEGSAGLGLSAVFGVLKQSNGFVIVDSELDKGTSFKLYLPRHLRDADLGCGVQISDSTVAQQETILLVDDELQFLDMTKDFLKALDYKVLSAESPGEALRLAKDHLGDIHLLITDVIMSEMNGQELANLIHNLRPNIQVIFISGYPVDMLVKQGVLDCATNLIQKPFSLKQLIIKIREVLKHK